MWARYPKMAGKMCTNHPKTPGKMWGKCKKRLILGVFCVPYFGYCKVGKFMIKYV